MDSFEWKGNDAPHLVLTCRDGGASNRPSRPAKTSASSWLDKARHPRGRCRARAEGARRCGRPRPRCRCPPCSGNLNEPERCATGRRRPQSRETMCPSRWHARLAERLFSSRTHAASRSARAASSGAHPPPPRARPRSSRVRPTTRRPRFITSSGLRPALATLAPRSRSRDPFTRPWWGPSVPLVRFAVRESCSPI
jgi:hypothetical protein